MGTPTLHLLMGLPGSGKTSLAQRLQKLGHTVHLSSDQFRMLLFPEPAFSQKEHDDIYRILDHNMQHLLESGVSVVYDANLNRHKHREEKYVVAKALNAHVLLWWLKTPQELSKDRRLSDQNSILLPPGESSANMFDRIASTFEPPRADEPHIVVDGSDVASIDIESLVTASKTARG